MMDIPTDPNLRLRRKELGKALRAMGIPVADATLASAATRGNGPRFQLFGRVPLYRWGDALDWVQEKLSPPCENTHGKNNDNAAA